MSERYKPMSEPARYYPGRENLERESKVDRFELDIEDITLDDLFAHLSKAPYRYWYRLLQIVRDRHGDEEANAVAREFGVRGGRALMRAMVRRFGELTPETMARYQDVAHYLMGRDMIDTEIEFDAHTCVVRRRHCSFAAAAPADMRHLCPIFNEGALTAYEEVHPGLSVTAVQHIVDGAPYCEHRFEFRTDKR